MFINKQLNLVIPLDRPDGTKVYVHSTPIMQETFEAYHLILAKTFASFEGNRLGAVAAPGIAALLMKEIAKNTSRSAGVSWWEGVDGVENGLFKEIRRLSNVITPTDDGWTTVPLDIALDQQLIDDEERGEVMNQVAFFIVVSTPVVPRGDRKTLVMGGATIFDALTTSLNCTEYANFLRTQRAPGSTGENDKT